MAYCEAWARDSGACTRQAEHMFMPLPGTHEHPIEDERAGATVPSTVVIQPPGRWMLHRVPLGLECGSPAFFGRRCLLVLCSR